MNINDIIVMVDVVMVDVVCALVLHESWYDMHHEMHFTHNVEISHTCCNVEIGYACCIV